MWKLKKYKAQDLYVGYLGVVKRKSKHEWTCDNSNILRKIAFLTPIDDFYDECRDVRTGSIYKSFHNINIIHENERGKVLYYCLVPLTTLTTQEKFTFKELKTWEDRLNNLNQPKVEVDDKVKTTNVPFFNVLLTYKARIEEINSEEKREELKTKVVELGRLYADTLMKIKMNMQLPTGLTLENPDESLRQLMAKELDKLDREIAMELNNNDLRSGVQILARSLGSDKK